MSRQPYKDVRYAWLTPSGEALDGKEYDDFGETGWVDYPMPAEAGKGGYEVLELVLGMSVVRTTLEFSPAMLGQWFPLITTRIDYAEPSFQAFTSRGLRGSVQESFPSSHLAISPGLDLFRHTDRYCSTFSVDGSFSGEAHHVSIGRTVLHQLIGEAMGDQLLAGLAINAPPALAVRPIPLPVSQMLMSAMTPTLMGPARNLYCQAKILEYLATLYAHVMVDKKVPKEHRHVARIRDLHDYLLTVEGQLPSLNELARGFNLSARRLNTEFMAEYGQSIFSFITHHRLEQARAAILESATPLKLLAARLGYSHVNHFITAFKRKFGYPPGSLRSPGKPVQD